jgi:hypothetical protein
MPQSDARSYVEGQAQNLVQPEAPPFQPCSLFLSHTHTHTHTKRYFESVWYSTIGPCDVCGAIPVFQNWMSLDDFNLVCCSA